MTEKGIGLGRRTREDHRNSGIKLKALRFHQRAVDNRKQKTKTKKRWWRAGCKVVSGAPTIGKGYGK